MDFTYQISTLLLSDNSNRLISNIEIKSVINKEEFPLAILINYEIDKNENLVLEDLENSFEKIISKDNTIILAGKTIDSKSINLIYYSKSLEKSEFSRIGEDEIFGEDGNSTIYFLEDSNWFIYDSYFKKNIEEIDQIFEDTLETIDVWVENNVNTESNFEVIHSFYSANKLNAEKFLNHLQTLGFEVKLNKTKTLFIFTGYEILVIKDQKWSTPLIFNTTLELLSIAKGFDIRFEKILAKVE